MKKIKSALISVFYKDGLEPIVRQFVDRVHNVFGKYQTVHGLFHFDYLLCDRRVTVRRNFCFNFYIYYNTRFSKNQGFSKIFLIFFREKFLRFARFSGLRSE